MAVRRWFAAVLLLVVAACESPAGHRSPPTAAAIAPGSTGRVSLDDRPFRLHVPVGYDAATTAPLVVLLHGYSVDAAATEGYFKLTAESDRRGFLYAMPEGTVDPRGKRFWNATDACCNFSGREVDDSGYLRRLVDTVKASYAVDAARVYFVGHSNGAFMAYRMACEHAARVTAIVSVAGALDNDTSLCRPERPVSILQVHGTADEVIAYRGGNIEGHSYPSVDATLATWRALNGCTGVDETSKAPIDLDARLPGPETTVSTFTGCRNSTRVVLWSIKDGLHSPAFNDTFAPSMMDFLYQQAPAA